MRIRLMIYTFLLLVVLLGLIVLAVPDKSGRVKVLYEGTENYKTTESSLKQSGDFEEIAEGINNNLNLREDVTIVLRECGNASPHYILGARKIVMCYESLEEIDRNFGEHESAEEAEFLAEDARYLILYRELGKAIADINKIPLSDEEAGKLGVYAASKAGNNAENPVFHAAMWFYTEDNSDESIIDKQKSFETVCGIYGKNAGKYSYLIDAKIISAEQAVECQAEYAVTKEKFRDLI